MNGIHFKHCLLEMSRSNVSVIECHQNVFGGFNVESITRGVFVGRFQPFHIGHLKVINHILSKEDELVIVVGSAQYSHTLDNPFTAGERIELIRKALDEEEIATQRYYLIPVEDVNIHAIWVSHMVSRIPRFQTVYSNEPLTRQLFEEASYSCEMIPFFNRKDFSATEIRNRILKDESWEELSYGYPGLYGFRWRIRP